MEQRVAQVIGLILIVVGLISALTFGQNQGFSAGIFAGFAYIGGFVLAFLGAYFLYVFGRTRKSEED